ncbi:DNA adenine methylase [Catellatospora sp. NPDC049609]|uniref:DNA adenine methylase n=1 Tax=Catellatospora sp. NPDC049609 TaxID=3155505 RepID=UPI00341CAD8B
MTRESALTSPDADHPACRAVPHVPVLAPRRLAGLADVPHALPYQGSKRRLAHAIVPLLPPDTDRLLEPFAGSAAVAIAARHLRIGRTAEISDVNEPLMRLWQRVLAEPGALADDYELLWREQLADPRAYYDAVRVRFNEAGEPHCLLYLLARCVKAAVRYNREGGFNQGPDKRRLGARPDTMRARLTATARTLAGCRAYCADYAEVLARAEPGDVVYLDPPYQGVSRARDHRYMAGLPREAFVARLRDAVAAGTSFVLSYDGVSRDRTGDRAYGDPLPADLGLLHLHVDAGTSTQATLHGRRARTVESLYVSPALVTRLGGPAAVSQDCQERQRAA